MENVGQRRRSGPFWRLLLLLFRKGEIRSMIFTCRLCGAHTEHNYGGDRYFPLCERCFQAEYFVCAECEDTIHASNRYQEPNAPEMDLCVACHMEHYTRCAECGISHRRVDMIQTDDGVFCQTCYEAQYVVCHECRGRIRRSESTETSAGNPICQSCMDYHYFRCQECGEVFHTSMARQHYGYCPNCFQTRFRLCDWCRQEHFPKTDLKNENAELHVTHFDGELAFCERCSASFRQEGVTNYGYKPFALMHGDRDGRHYGIELEVDGGGCNRDHANIVKGIANRDAINIYTKSDGSLNDGFEIVTHPMTLDYLMEAVPWEELFKKLVSLNYRSHQACTCGLHIHVERKALGMTGERQETVISNILFLVEKHWDQMLDFSRRTKNQVDSWARRYGVKSRPDELLNTVKYPDDHDYNPHSRYACVNLLPEATIEFRIFRGTLKLSTFLATVQFVDEICNKAVELSCDEMVDLSWKQFVMGIDPDEKPELVRYLKERQLYVNELVPVGANVEEGEF